MATQVKFYSTATLPSNANNGGIYFVGGSKTGELYKGTTRFGAGRVTEVANLSVAPSDAIRGDIAVCAAGGTYAYDGEKWVAIGPDLSAVKASWQSDITYAINALDVSFIGASSATSIITGIKQVDGKIVAHAEKFPQLTSPSDGHVALNGTNVEISGWSALVTAKNDLQSSVTGLETWKGSITGDAIVTGTKVTAETGKFKNLTVSDTATFSATDVKATTLTVDSEAGATFGSLTISAIADREALAKIAAIASATQSSSANGVGVTVVTQSGSIKSVAVTADVTSGTADFTSTSTKIAKAGDVAKYVDNKLLNINGAMRFYGTTTAESAGTVSTENITKASADLTALKAGDVVINTTYATEYIYDGNAWHELGDESHHSTKGFTGEGSVTLTTTAQTLAGGINELDKELGTITAAAMGTTADTVSGAIKELDGKVDTLTGEGEGSVKKALVDAKAYTDTEVKKVTDAFTGGENTDGTDGVSVKVVTAAKTAAPTVTVTVTKATLNSTLGTTAVADKTVATTIGNGSDTALATTSAVKAAITDAALVWCGADGNPIE